MHVPVIESLKVLWALIIPPVDASPTIQYLYRVRVAAVACAGFMISISYAAFTYGMTPWFDGFAKTSEVRALRIHILDEQLLGLRIHHCSATNAEARQQYLRRIQIMQEEYYELVKIPYTLPGCNEVQ
jgi:hypothetical protein